MSVAIRPLVKPGASNPSPQIHLPPESGVHEPQAQKDACQTALQELYRQEEELLRQMSSARPRHPGPRSRSRPVTPSPQQPGLREAFLEVARRIQLCQVQLNLINQRIEEAALRPFPAASDEPGEESSPTQELTPDQELERRVVSSRRNLRLATAACNAFRKEYAPRKRLLRTMLESSNPPSPAEDLRRARVQKEINALEAEYQRHLNLVSVREQELHLLSLRIQLGEPPEY